MNEKELIGNYLSISGYEDFKKEHRITTLSIALRGARHLCGRDTETGLRKTEDELINKSITDLEGGFFYSSQFLGLTNYLIILDLVGSLFNNKSVKKKSKDGFEHALIHFTELNDAHISALKSLRNSLAHNFGLGTSSHIFSLSDSYIDMILLPSKGNEWHNSTNDKELSRTQINGVLLCDFIESVITSLSKEFTENNLGLKGGINELKLESNFTVL
jgi:hypothetical protein